MELWFSPLASGSSGNCAYLCAGDTGILVDAGISCARATRDLLTLGAKIEECKGILITHEHTDHVLSAGALSRKYDLPIYATQGTWREMSAKIGDVALKNTRIIEREQDFYIGDINISPFPIPHDAQEPCGYAFRAGGCKISVATDLGEVRDGWMRAVEDSDLLLLESNYDADMLNAGRYPYALKKRIMGKKGHLSNDDASAAAVLLAAKRVKYILLGHMSRENNFPELAWETAVQTLRASGIEPEKDLGLALALRDRMSGLYCVRDGMGAVRRL